MVHIKRGYMNNGVIVYTVTPASIDDFIECRDLMIRMDHSYCDDGLLTLSQNVEIVNNIPTFMFTVDNTTLAMRKNASGVFEHVFYEEASPHINFS